jgi:hypothetical protein
MGLRRISNGLWELEVRSTFYLLISNLIFILLFIFFFISPQSFDYHSCKIKEKKKRGGEERNNLATTNDCI